MVYKTVLLKLVAGAALAAGLAMSAHAVLLTGNQVISPYILAGAPPDTPAAHVDPNVATSPYSGVVSINIRYSGSSFICSGALVSSRHVLSAGHCVDTDGMGHVINLATPGNDVRVVFNATGAGAGAAVVTASAVSMNPNYAGFGNCPAGVMSFCVNDDIAVITLPVDAPADARIYRVSDAPVLSGQQIVMAGYGTSGDGINGFTISPAFRVKRTGENLMDIFEGDDENFTGLDPFGFIQGGTNEVYYADFDGTNSSGVPKNTNCTFFGVCTAQLANNLESNIGGGDSGGPSFIRELSGELILVANNTFGWSGFGEENPGAFGSDFGGILLQNYIPYLRSATGGLLQVVPEPGSLALMGLALFAAVAARRRVRS